MNDIVMQAVRAYRHGKTIEVIQFLVGGEWGVPFTLPTTACTVMAHVGDQYRAMGATKLRHIRRARLQSGSTPVRDVAIETVFPDQRQRVFDVSSGRSIQVGYLRDARLATLEQRFGQTPRG